MGIRRYNKLRKEDFQETIHSFKKKNNIPKLRMRIGEKVRCNTTKFNILEISK